MQHCWMLHVASVGASCCKLLRVVWSCCAKFETGQTVEPTTPNISFVLWSPKRSATMLDPFAPLFQHSWGHARAQYTMALHMVTHGLQSLMGCILPTMHSRTQHCRELLHSFAHRCKNVWELLRPFARTLKRNSKETLFCGYYQIC